MTTLIISLDSHSNPTSMFTLLRTTRLRDVGLTSASHTAGLCNPTGASRDPGPSASEPTWLMVHADHSALS